MRRTKEKTKEKRYEVYYEGQFIGSFKNQKDATKYMRFLMSQGVSECHLYDNLDKRVICRNYTEIPGTTISIKDVKEGDEIRYLGHNWRCEKADDHDVHLIRTSDHTSISTEHLVLYKGNYTVLLLNR